mgnify:CR=1 FL=1
MRSAVLAAVAAAALGVGLTNTSVVAAGNSFMGEAAPEIQVGDWINGDGRTDLADYKGEVVLLEFWQTH